MTILFFVSNHHELKQRAYNELVERGHIVNLQPAGSDAAMIAAAAHIQPQLIIAPFLKRALPAAILKKNTVLLIRPNSLEDRGPSSLTGAVVDNLKNCRLTLLQSAKEEDCKDIPMTPCPTMYPRRSFQQHHFNRSVVDSILEIVDKLESNSIPLQPSSSIHEHQLKGRLHSMGF